MHKKILTIGILILFIAILGLYTFKTSAPEETKAVDKTGATFRWSYEPYETEFIPRNIISLTATYTDGTTETKKIEDIDGGCNAYENRDADVYKNSEMIICYYAGFGRYYKVVETPTGFDIKRKEFEEGNPEYTPPILPFETIVKF